jgi:type III pantothenate kinase
MLLAVDVGNTNTVIGLFEGDGDGDEVVDHWRAATMSNRTADEWLLIIGQFLSWRNIAVSELSGLVICSVVPMVTTALRRMCDRIQVDPLIVNWQTDTGMPVLLANPSEIGADRIANGVAAYASTHQQTIVVDLGTATSFDIVSADGEFIGGIILPGIEISLNALFDRAAALGRIELTTPPKVVGDGTVNAMRSGATYGYAAQVDGLCRKVEEEVGECRILATGGLSGAIASLSEKIERHDPWLTLRGLKQIYSRGA